MTFEWDENKNKSNRLKHGISFETAIRIFDNYTLTMQDNKIDYGEVKEVSIGEIEDTFVILVIHTDRSGATRVISARRANKHERSKYYEAKNKRFKR